jgi:hypothetical protein
VSLEHAPDVQGANAAFDDLELPKFVRYLDLEAAGLFNSRMTLDRAIRRGDFPPGRVMGNARFWTRPEIVEALSRLNSAKLAVRNPTRRDASRPAA